MTAAKMKIKLDKIVSSYNGAVGCMCGCNGDHAYASAVADKGKEIRGYKIKSDEVSDRKVKSRMNKLQKMIDSGEYDEVDYGSNYIYAEMNGRCTAVYFS